MSTDHYPTCDVRDLDSAAGRLEPRAAVLLHRNDDVRWPEFKGRDLSHLSRREVPEPRRGRRDDRRRHPEELARLGHDSSDPGMLLTLSAGGNDLLDAWRRVAARQGVRRSYKRYTELVETIREELPRATLVLTTVYDPTDGTGRLPDGGRWHLPLEYLDQFNDHVRETADSMPKRCWLTSTGTSLDMG